MYLPPHPHPQKQTQIMAYPPDLPAPQLNLPPHPTPTTPQPRSPTTNTKSLNTKSTHLSSASTLTPNPIREPSSIPPLHASPPALSDDKESDSSTPPHKKTPIHTTDPHTHSLSLFLSFSLPQHPASPHTPPPLTPKGRQQPETPTLNLAERAATANNKQKWKSLPLPEINFIYL